MKEETIKALIGEREKLDVNDDDRLEEIWKREATILTEDISETIRFIEHECDDETFYWLSEVFDDVARETQSRAFVEAVRTRLADVKDSKYKDDIAMDLSFAEEAISNPSESLFCLYKRGLDF